MSKYMRYMLLTTYCQVNRFLFVLLNNIARTTTMPETLSPTIAVSTALIKILIVFSECTSYQV